jgi:perosamine synthetase
LARLKRVDELIACKQQIFSWYREFLSSVDGLMLNVEIPGTLNTYWMVTMVVSSSLGWVKEYLVEMMKAEQIDCRPFLGRLSSLRGTEKQAQHAQERNGVGYRLNPYRFNLPFGLQMTQEKVARVCGALKLVAQNRIAALSGRV